MRECAFVSVCARVCAYAYMRECITRTRVGGRFFGANEAFSGGAKRNLTGDFFDFWLKIVT